MTQTDTNIRPMLFYTILLLTKVDNLFKPEPNGDHNVRGNQ